MENGAQQALSKRVGVIRFELGRFTLSKPRPNEKGGWWIVEVDKGNGYQSFERFLQTNHSFNDYLYEWTEINCRNQVLFDNHSLWFKELDDAVLFWMTFR